VSAPWWAGIPAAEATLDCGAGQHRLSWAAGQLHAPDHGDLEGEQILSALAGQGFPCLDVLNAWAQHSADLRVLVLASRGPADPLVMWSPPSSGGAGPTGRRARRAMAVARMSGGGHRASSRGHPDEPEDEVTRLIGLGGPLPDRLAATVIAHWAERLRGAPGGEVDAARPALHAALYGRLTAALREWTGQPRLKVTLAMIPENQPPRLTRDAAGIAAELPFSWLAEVWARGLSRCWGRFCLAAAPSPAGDGWVLSTTGPGLDPPQPLTIGNPPAS
jgi:hypothetical protein